MGASSASAIRYNRPADMRFVPLSYFCTCWNVTPKALPSSVWLNPRCNRMARTRLAISASRGSRLRVPMSASEAGRENRAGIGSSLPAGGDLHRTRLSGLDGRRD